MSNILQLCHQQLDDALLDVERAIKLAKSSRSRQLTKNDDLDYFKSLAYSWFHSRLPKLNELWPGIELGPISGCFKNILDSTAKRTLRSVYQSTLKNVKKEIVTKRGELVLNPAPGGDVDVPPDFSKLVGDATMQQILFQRWDECQICVSSGTYLAATVMMGGLLEALFVAYANRLKDKSPMFSAKAAPQDPKTKKTLQLSKWTLRPYIDVGHELGWITRSGKDVAEVLRDYRNYVHPEKQRSHGVTLQKPDAEMFWDVTKHIANQLLANSKP